MSRRPLLGPTWPPGFTPRMPELMRGDQANADRSVGLTVKRQKQMESDDLEERRAAQRAIRGLSSSAEDKLHGRGGKP